MTQYARLSADHDPAGDGPARLAGLPGGGRARFAVRRGEHEPWVPLASLGLNPADTPELISVSAEAAARLAAGQGTPVPGSGPLRCPVVRPGKMIAIGLNYMDHIRETGATRPDRPIAFAKYPSSLNDPSGDLIVDPGLTAQPDYEAELAVIIGSPAYQVSRSAALGVVFGYAVANDVSARDLQRAESQFSRSKSMDTFCPVGPWITTADQVPDPQALAIECQVNDEIRQKSMTAEMIFPVAELIAHLSRTMTLLPGDVILTGTPHGVGLGRKPPAFLAEGDLVRVRISGLGSISNKVARPARLAGPS
ncbi:MAG TPA: fumarylacetoacetate hydrolase family protein [Streptosporangiaceae bacterium]|jgi:2-keto-4-pentenoate hydratase/2-oxohepta-3-ene-1,7-dioic acid hydratase in catechol pathway